MLIKRAKLISNSFIVFIFSTSLAYLFMEAIISMHHDNSLQIAILFGFIMIFVFHPLTKS